jgi:type IV pilus assembly protein PilA
VLAILGIGVLLVGVLAVLGIFGVRKYIANAKTAEARVTVREIATDAVSAYEAGATPPSPYGGGSPYGGRYGGGLGLVGPRRLCASASHPVPPSLSEISGKKWMSLPGDWAEDRTTNAGFACLHFEMSAPQYYQYNYTRHGTGTLPGDGFTAQASGDLDGDGDVSTFELDGRIDPSGTVTIEPTIVETNPEE